jgi:hypothetical protein
MGDTHHANGGQSDREEKLCGRKSALAQTTNEKEGYCLDETHNKIGASIDIHRI